ncbi:type II toxin-antitoxin system VapB family antitoxin [Streptomyces sp. NPDC006660]|uniref:type II toxin-antitoxin system VapB family antitoxin n=1 Tax=Streptomyces sp. NPDC006660 TaxID=3156901 RepID=UPI003409B260
MGHPCARPTLGCGARSAAWIDIDDEVLAEAMRLSGARAKEETVNALREYAERRRRAPDRPKHLRATRDRDEESFGRPHAVEKGAS